MKQNEDVNKTNVLSASNGETGLASILGYEIIMVDT